MKRRRECVYGGELDLSTLIWTRGSTFPLAMLETRLKCPRCGSRRVVVLFEPPSMRHTMRVRQCVDALLIDLRGERLSPCIG